MKILSRGGVHPSFALLLGSLALGCSHSPDNEPGNGNGGSSGAAQGGTNGVGGSGTGGSSTGGSNTGGSNAGGSSTGGNMSAGGSGGSGGSTSGGGGSGGSGGLPADASAGCGKPASTGLSDGMLTVGADERTFKLYVTAGYSPNEAVSLVFGFHGNGGTGDQGYSFGIQTAAETAGDHAVFMFPNGLPQQGGVGWAMGKDEMDVAYFDAMVAYAEDTFCIDKNRIFVSGFSWGCDFSNTLGCYRGDVIRAVQCYSGALYSNGCTEETPAYRVSYSTPDGTDAYSESAMVGALNHYKTAQGCGDTTQAATPSPCLSYDGCSEPVIYCAYPSMGHAVPSTAGTDTWAFFSSLE